MFRPFNPLQQAKAIKQFLQKEARQTGFQKLIIGLSGGIDSTVSTYLAVSALQPENVFVCLFPYQKLSFQGLKSAEKTIKNLKIPKKNIIVKDITKICELIFQTERQISKERKGNIIARVRMILLYDLSQKHKALVMGTENKSEYLLGYYTRFGDEACDLEPIRHLYKTEVKKLAKYLKIPQEIINSVPSANLYQGQTDEGQLGFSYDQADPILFYLFEKRLTLQAIEKQGFNKETVEKVAHWVKKNQFKFFVPKKLAKTIEKPIVFWYN